jgi:ankyrin repeat protein
LEILYLALFKELTLTEERMAEIKVAGDVTDENVKKHIAGKFPVDKTVSSAAKQNEKYGPCTLLWWAAYGGHPVAVADLLKAGAKKDFKAKNGETPLMIATRKEKSDEVVKLLGGTPKPKPVAAPAAAAAKPAAAAAKPAAAAAKPAGATAPAAAPKKN